ncbi:MAG TPA: AbrB/MazE/SpoVT family DNA-binding domain-containing protein [archaeon]|nr:AbrB/MazE/SpoVT family DNA-binding domain-containing protein [archaeon]
MAEAKVDSKGRISISSDIRKEFGIEPFDKVEYEIKKIRHRKKFTDYAGTLKDKKGRSAVQIIKEESPFR